LWQVQACTVFFVRKEQNLYAMNMKAMADSYSLRLALSADAEVIARHRVIMFRDMKALTEGKSNKVFTAILPAV